VMTVNDRIRALSKLPKFGPLPQELRSRISGNRSRDRWIALRAFTLLALTLAAVSN